MVKGMVVGTIVGTVLFAVPAAYDGRNPMVVGALFGGLPFAALGALVGGKDEGWQRLPLADRPAARTFRVGLAPTRDGVAVGLRVTF